MVYQAALPPLLNVESQGWNPGGSEYERSGGPMPANTFALKHREVEVEYTIGLTPSGPALTHKDGSSATVNLSSAAITPDETALGSLVSVPLVRTVDTGGERIGFFLPRLDVAPGGVGALHDGGRVRKVRRSWLGPPLAAHRGGASSCTAWRNP